MKKCIFGILAIMVALPIVLAAQETPTTDSQTPTAQKPPSRKAESPAPDVSPEDRDGTPARPPRSKRGFRPRRHRHGPWAQDRDKAWSLSKEDEKKLLAFVKKYHPRMYERLTDLRQDNEARYKKALRRIWPRFEMLMAMPKEIRDAHIKQTTLKVELFKTAKKLHNTKDEKKRSELVAKLRELVAEQFDIQQKVRLYRLKQMEKQLERLEKDLKQRAADRDKIIESRLERYQKRLKRRDSDSRFRRRRDKRPVDEDAKEKKPEPKPESPV
ncbi:MAG: hypothetical protein K8S55_10335 [Phycisphaerae bacterium]|nr:hypothetical protein [Phycisphaerae bacterium]